MDDETIEVNRIKCRKCKKWVYYSTANTVIYWWPKYLWYTIAQTICDKCDYRQACFLVDNLKSEVEWAINNNIGFVEQEGLPSNNVLKSFHEFYPDHATYHRLSAKEQSLVGYLAYLMDSVPQNEWFNS